MEPNKRIDAVFVTGHTFGEAALHGLLDSRNVHISRLFVLDAAYAERTVGFSQAESCWGEVGSVTATRDGRLISHVNELRELKPALLFVIGWSYIIPAPILDVAAHAGGQPQRHGPFHGAIGMHPTALPVGRGRAPIPWTILNGVEETALSAFRLEESVDSGAIVAIHRIELPKEAKSSCLFDAVEDAHYQLGREIGLSLGFASGLSDAPQDEARATYYPRRSREDSEIRSSMTASDVDALVRAQSGPYPAAYLRLPAGGSAEISATERAHNPERHRIAGTMNIEGLWITFECADGPIRLRSKRYIAPGELVISA